MHEGCRGGWLILPLTPPPPFFFDCTPSNVPPLTVSALYGEEDGTIQATFQVVYMIGWAPHESQPQPKRRGSGQVRGCGTFQGTRLREAGAYYGRGSVFSLFSPTTVHAFCLYWRDASYIYAVGDVSLAVVPSSVHPSALVVYLLCCCCCGNRSTPCCLLFHGTL